MMPSKTNKRRQFVIFARPPGDVILLKRKSVLSWKDYEVLSVWYSQSLPLPVAVFRDVAP